VTGLMTNENTTPDDLYGRGRPDRFMKGVGVFMEALVGAVKTVYGTAKTPPAVDVALSLVVTDVHDEAEGVRSVRFGSRAGGPLPAWQPGCHLDITLPSGRRRQYSLCGDPTDNTTYRIAVRRMAGGGGGSVEVHETLRPGVEISVRGPRNAFPYVIDRPTLFIAGGIGITPILPMVRAAARRGADIQFVYTGRSRASMPFLAELSDINPARVRIRPDDEFGVPDAADLLADATPGGAVYCCGPEPMLNAVRAAFPATGARSLHFEHFAAPPIVDGKPFEIELRRSGVVLPVPADVSALDVVKTALPGVAYSCQQGFCGTCQVRVLGGTVDHRDHRLTEQQRAEGDMLICVSRADGGRLVIDI
jgi:ferredoxin-NADP reductase